MTRVFILTTLLTVRASWWLLDQMVREPSGYLQEHCFTRCTWAEIFDSFLLPLRSLANDSGLYHSLEHSSNLGNCRILFCGNNNLISISVGGWIISSGLGAPLQNQGGTGLNSCMTNKQLLFYGQERKGYFEDYQFRLEMIHPKVFNGLGDRNGDGGSIYLSPTTPTSQKRTVCYVLGGV